MGAFLALQKYCFGGKVLFPCVSIFFSVTKPQFLFFYNYFEENAIVVVFIFLSGANLPILAAFDRYSLRFATIRRYSVLFAAIRHYSPLSRLGKASVS